MYPERMRGKTSIKFDSICPESGHSQSTVESAASCFLLYIGKTCLAKLWQWDEEMLGGGGDWQ